MELTREMVVQLQDGYERQRHEVLRKLSELDGALEVCRLLLVRVDQGEAAAQFARGA